MNINKKIIVYMATNDSVQFHENILDTFLNRKYSKCVACDDDENEPEINLKSENKRICEVFALNDKMDQKKRSEIFKKFCKAIQGIIILTDVAARGIDMSNVDLILHYNHKKT